MDLWSTQEEGKIVGAVHLRSRHACTNLTLRVGTAEWALRVGTAEWARTGKLWK